MRGLIVTGTVFLTLVALIFGGCLKSNKIQLCEGVTPEGDGVNCGKKFEDGELTAVITSEDPFGVKTISVHVYEIKEQKTDKIETIQVDVNPDKQTATVNLSFYTGGRYSVRAMKNDVIIGEKEVEIVEK